MTKIVHAFTLIINSYNATQLNRWVKELFLPGWWHYISNVPAGPLPNSKDAHFVLKLNTLGKKIRASQ